MDAPIYERFDTNEGFQAAVDRLLEQPGRELRVFDPDGAALRLNDPARIDAPRALPAREPHAADLPRAARHRPPDAALPAHDDAARALLARDPDQPHPRGDPRDPGRASWCSTRCTTCAGRWRPSSAARSAWATRPKGWRCAAASRRSGPRRTRGIQHHWVCSIRAAVDPTPATLEGPCEKYRLIASRRSAGRMRSVAERPSRPRQRQHRPPSARRRRRRRWTRRRPMKK